MARIPATGSSTGPSPRRTAGMPGPGGRHHGTRIEKAKDVRTALHRLISRLRPFRLALLGLFFLVVVSTVVTLFVPFLIGLAIDDAIAVRDLSRLQAIIAMMAGAYLISWIMSAIQNVIMVRVSQEMMRELRRELFDHMQTLSLGFFDRHPHGELMSRLTNDLDAISRVLSQNVTELFSGMITLVGILVMMFAINFWLALGSMIVFPLMMGLVGIVGKRTRKGFRAYQMHIGQLNGKLEEMYSGQREIVAFGKQATVLDDFDQANEKVRQVGVQAQTYALLVPPLMGILSNANVAILAGLGGWMVLNGWATVGTIAAFYTYSRRFAAPLRQLGNLYNQVQSALAGAERVFEILDTKPELTDDGNAVSLKEIKGEVVFDRVEFGYVADVPVINEVSLQAKPGQTVALVGPTGAGKTTLVNLLARFYDVDNGSIRIDGRDVRNLPSADLRRQLGIVLQDTFLFAESVRENIRYGRLDASDEEVVAAAWLASADHFIRSLPQGYDTELSERGSNLSQGQRQLLSIARAVLADPRILILDEATSSVDTRTEVQIQQALLRLMQGRTSFVIAHRLSTIRDADQVLVIRDGRIIEQGTHDELIEMGGFYYNLTMSQFKGLDKETIQDMGGVC